MSNATTSPERVVYYSGEGCEGMPAIVVRAKKLWMGSSKVFADIRLENGRLLESVHVGAIKSGAYVETIR